MLDTTESVKTLEKRLCQQAQKYPVVAVTGPRQSGKTTLVGMTFPDRPYVTLEDSDNRRPIAVRVWPEGPFCSGRS